MLRLFVSILLAVNALTLSVEAADLKKTIRPADWSKICEDRGHGRPACKNNCQQMGNSVGCNVHCADDYKIGNCLVGVSCPSKHC